MSKEVNNIVVSIISNNISNKKNAIQELIKLTSVYQNADLKSIQKAILLLLEGEHDWNNVVKFI
jgi:hypothetical protein